MTCVPTYLQYVCRYVLMRKLQVATQELKVAPESSWFHRLGIPMQTLNTTSNSTKVALSHALGHCHILSQLFAYSSYPTAHTLSLNHILFSDIMRSSFLLFGLAAVALANLNQNANEMRDVSDIEGSKVEADPPTKMFERARPCCSSGNDGCVSGQTHMFILSKKKEEALVFEPD